MFCAGLVAIHHQSSPVARLVKDVRKVELPACIEEFSETVSPAVKRGIIIAHVFLSSVKHESADTRVATPWERGEQHR